MADGREAGAGAADTQLARAENMSTSWRRQRAASAADTPATLKHTNDES